MPPHVRISLRGHRADVRRVNINVVRLASCFVASRGCTCDARVARRVRGDAPALMQLYHVSHVRVCSFVSLTSVYISFAVVERVRWFLP